MPAHTPPSLLFFLDSSAFMNGADYPPAECRTTPSILAEFRPGGRQYARVDRYQAAGLVVVEPDPASLQRAQDAARAAGSLARLSRPDLDLLAAALAQEGRAVVVSDDYTVQDVARRLGLATRSIRTEGIGGTRDWTARCAGCGRTYDAGKAGTVCTVCGSAIQLKVKTSRGRPR